LHRFDHTHGKAARENAVGAGCVEHVAGLDFFLEGHIVHLAQGSSLPFERAGRLSLLRDHAGGEIRVGDQLHRGRHGVGGDHFAHNAIRRHHRHAALHARHSAAIHENHLGTRPRADRENGGGHGLRGRVPLKYLQRLGAVGAAQFALQENVVQLEAVELSLQAAVFGVGIVQQNVVVKKARTAAAQAFHDARHRGDGRHRPDADQPHILIVLHLNREQHKLREDHEQQNGNVPVPVE